MEAEPGKGRKIMAVHVCLGSPLRGSEPTSSARDLGWIELVESVVGCGLPQKDVFFWGGGSLQMVP